MILQIQNFILCNVYDIFKMNMTIFDEFERFFNQAFVLPNQSAWCRCEITTGPDGKPFVRGFGNVSGQAGGARPIQVEAITDTEKNKVKLVAEIPGVDKKDISVSLNEGQAIIEATRGENRYEAYVPVRHDVNPNDVKATYKNGILEVVFNLENKPKGTVVRVD